MRNKTVATHLFCLCLFVGGCGVFWLLGGGVKEEIPVEVAITESNTEIENSIEDKRLIGQTSEEKGGEFPHNTSLNKQGGYNCCPTSPSTSQTASNAITGDKSCAPSHTSMHLKESATITEYNEAEVNDESASAGFHSMEKADSAKRETVIGVVVHGEQKNINTDSQVKLRLLDDVSVNGVVISKNTVVYAKVRLSDDRIFLTTESITHDKKEYPFSADIYETDGTEGMRKPDTKTGADKKESKVMLPSGYRLMLKQK